MGIVDRTGKYIFTRVFGAMTERQIAATTLRAGRSMIKAAAENGGNLSADLARGILRSNLPQTSKMPLVSGNIEEMTKLFKGCMPDSTLSEFVAGVQRSSLASSLQSPNGKALLYLPDGLAENAEALIVTGTHEFRHCLDYNYGVLGILRRFLCRVIPKPLKMIATKKSMKFQKPYMNIQGKLVGILGLPHGQVGKINGNMSEILNGSRKEVIAYYRSLLKKETKEWTYKERLMFLGHLKRLNESEFSAYSAGGKIGREFCHLGENQEHISELVATNQKLFLDAINAELQGIKIARKAGVRQFSCPKRKLRRAANVPTQIRKKPEAFEKVRAEIEKGRKLSCTKTVVREETIELDKI
ncbi:MAG: hypothetical protein K6A44_04385 [bacterium]|nr:hypothetical protein [bacterium]